MAHQRRRAGGVSIANELAEPTQYSPLLFLAFVSVTLRKLLYVSDCARSQEQAIKSNSKRCLLCSEGSRESYS